MRNEKRKIHLGKGGEGKGRIWIIYGLREMHMRFSITMWLNSVRSCYYYGVHAPSLTITP